MRPRRARLFLATVSLALGVLLPVARAADSTGSPATASPSARARDGQLLQERDPYLQATVVDATSPERVRRAARRFANGRLAQLELESPRSPQPNATGVLSGRVTSAVTGAGIGGVEVDIYRPRTTGGYQWWAVIADASGNYSSAGLTTGTYYAKTRNHDGFIDEAWNNIPCNYGCIPVNTGATPIAVTDGSTTPNIDFALDPGGRITGTAVNASTAAPIADLDLWVYDASGQLAAQTLTDASGVFLTGSGFASGKYFVRTYTSGHSLGFVDELYDNILCNGFYCTPSAGTPVVVTAPSTTGGIDFALDLGGGLAGKVTDASTSGGLSGVEVDIYGLDGRTVGYAYTDASGNYTTVRNIPPGAYTAVASQWSGYINEVWNDIPFPGCWPWSCEGKSLGTLINVAAGTLTSGIDFALDKGGRIAGKVTDASTTTGIPQAEVDIYTEDGKVVAYGYTDGTGSYTTFTGLGAGRYRARTTLYLGGSPGGYVNEVYDDVPCAGAYGCPLAQGSLVNVGLGTTTSGIDFALDLGGRISGSVKDATTTTGLPKVDVDIYSEGGRYMTYGYTDGTGAYVTFAGLPAGRYYAKTGSPAHVDEAYDDVACPACRPEVSGTAVGVTPGATTPGIDFALDRGGQISGRITRATDGTAVSASISVYTLSGALVKTVSTGASGNYSVSGLPSGRYVVRTSTNSGLVDEVYDDRPCVGSTCELGSGTPVAVAAGSTTPAIDFALSPGARISGRVTDQATGNGIPGVRVNVLKPPYGTVASLSTDGFGYFSNTAAAILGRGLPTGGYYVQTNNTQGYLDELYDNIPCLGCDVTAGTKVQLTSGATTSGVNIALARGGRIAGTVTRAATGDPVALLTVRIYDSTGRPVSSLTTDHLGAYRSGGLPAGTYYVAASVNAADYVDELYDNVPFGSGGSPLVGTPVTVTGGATVSGIDIALDGGGRIEGRVTDASTSAPVLDANVSVFDASGRAERSVSVDAHGNYAAHGLAPGTHHALASVGSAYVSQLYDSVSCPACSPTTGTPITVTAGTTTSGIHFALAGGGRIEGSVSRASDGQPISASVTIYDAAGDAVAGATPDGSGYYRSSRGLPSGLYYAKAHDALGTYDDELFANQPCGSCNPTTGTPITVNSPAATTGVDFSLDGRSLGFFTLNPCRVVDTRSAPSALGGPALNAREDRVLSVFAACGIPLTAKAVSVNLTATGATTVGHLRLHPGGEPVPGVSSLNYAAGQNRANNAVVPVSRFGELAVYCNQASGTVHFILDVNGYFQ